MNVARVMGNSRDEKYMADLIRAFEENSDERVRAMTVWAIGIIGGPDALTALKGLIDESGDLVKEEIRWVRESC